MEVCNSEDAQSDFFVIEYLPPRHLLPWSNTEEEDDAQEELLLSKNQEMWNEKYLKYLHHFGYDPIQCGGTEGVTSSLSFLLTISFFLYFFLE